MAGAEVRVVNQNQTVRTFTTPPTGGFVVPNVDPVKMAGFKQFEKKDLRLAPSDSMALGDLVLALGDVPETVEVKAEIGMLQTASAERSSLLDSHEVMD